MEDEKLYLAEGVGALDEDLGQDEEYVIDEGLTENDFYETLELTFERTDGTKEVYEVVSLFSDEDGRNHYIAMIPKGETEADLTIVPFEEGPDGNCELRDFRSDEEFAEAQRLMEQYHSEETGEEAEALNADQAAEELPESDKEWISGVIRDLRHL